ncbi:HD family phosphohydrolase [Spirochaeta thermophila]|uniref:HD domain-containing protein n=1 Tax=Winmispira thermophila (strain ATCC 49972 / DSM 6192 / RI 19.B1) TaxID=665571 RepID=E0RSD4_WINT6|nr:HDIG domain-containing metalloprotein [Spirochaeta thermophila]ADN01921.1 hypothetical protein STHERM_c09750 [Spirochaeta thermophila DSM 6192]
MKETPRSPFLSFLFRVVGRLRRLPLDVLWGAAVVLCLSLIQVGGLRVLDLLERPSYDDFEVGRVAERDVVLDRDVVVVDEKATAIRLSAMERLVPPVFVLDRKVTEIMQREFAAVRELVLDPASRGPSSEADVKGAYFRFQARLPGMLSEEEFTLLFEAAAHPRWREALSSLMQRVEEQGVFRLPDSEVLGYADTVELRIPSEGETFRALSRSMGDVLTRSRLSEVIEEYRTKYGFTDREVEALELFVSRFIRENVVYDRRASEEKRDAILSNVEPVVREFKKGDVIVRKGFVLTEDDVATLNLLKRYRVFTVPRSFLWEFVFSSAVLFLGFLLLRMAPDLQSSAAAGFWRFFSALLVLLILLGFGLRILFPPPEGVSPGVLLLLPVCALFLPVFWGRERSLLAVGFLSVFFLPFFGFDMHAYLFSLAMGMGGVLLVHGVRQRMDLIRSSLILTVVSIPVTGVLGGLASLSLTDVGTFMGYGAANVLVSGMLVTMLLPLIEHLLNAPTRFRLLELSDLNTPLLKRMLAVAPGTYSHSMMVAQLAEAAAEVVGANPLLARVGSYYHDIGKIEQPEYFVENQRGTNRHDDLNPSLSSAVIKAHAKRGVEIAKKMGFPQAVIDIIAQHHGDDLIKYFYQEAVKKNGGEVSREDYSYSGDRPLTREAAIVMLADAVEAAVRALSGKPSHAAIEKRVHAVIFEKLKNGQLDDAPLTIKDLTRIEETFVRILAASVHTRIEYPDTKKDPRSE